MTHHCRDVQLVVLEAAPVFHVQGHFGQSHRGAEVEEGSDAVIRKVLMGEEEDRRQITDMRKHKRTIKQS